MVRVLLDGVINTDYGQFDLVWSGSVGFDGDFDRFFAGQVNGLVGAVSGDGVYLNLARRSGGSAVRIELLETEPALADAYEVDSYEDIVEVSVTVPADAEVSWTSWAGETEGRLDGIPSGSYRCRVSARGRDAGAAGEFADGVVDSYLVQLWPTAPAPDSIIRVGQRGRPLLASRGGRPPMTPGPARDVEVGAAATVRNFESRATTRT
ncbi:MAG: hypothetical protein QM650_18025 [Microlunatus sp.]